MATAEAAEGTEVLQFNDIVSKDYVNLHLVQGWRAGLSEKIEEFGLCAVADSPHHKTITINNMELSSDQEQLPLLLTVRFNDFVQLSRFEITVGARFVEVYFPDPVDPASFVYVKTVRGTISSTRDASDKAPYLHEYDVEALGGQRIAALRLKLLSFKSSSTVGASTKRSCFIKNMSFIFSTCPTQAQSGNLASTLPQPASSSSSSSSMTQAPQILAGLLKASLQPRPPVAHSSSSPAPVAPPQGSLPSLSALQPMLLAVSAMFDEKLKPLQQQLDRLESKIEQLAAVQQKLLGERDLDNNTKI